MSHSVHKLGGNCKQTEQDYCLWRAIISNTQKPLTTAEVTRYSMYTVAWCSKGTGCAPTETIVFTEVRAHEGVVTEGWEGVPGRGLCLIVIQWIQAWDLLQGALIWARGAQNQAENGFLSGLYPWKGARVLAWLTAPSITDRQCGPLWLTLASTTWKAD